MSPRGVVATGVLFAIVACGVPCAARPVASARDLPLNRLGLELLFDPQLMLEARYARRLPDLVRGHDLTLEASFGAPLFLLGGADAFELTVGAASEIPIHGRFGVTVALATALATTENANGTFVAWELEIAALPGFYAERWFLALNLAYRPTLSTHVRHSAAAREAFDDRYPEGTPADQQRGGPEDGWYAFPVHRWALGLVGGYRFGKRVTLYGGGGIDAMAGGEGGLFWYPTVGVLPIYAQFGVSVGW